MPETTNPPAYTAEEQRLGRLIYDALCTTNEYEYVGYLYTGSVGPRVCMEATIDGNFDLLAVARALNTALNSERQSPAAEIAAQTRKYSDGAV